MGKRGRNPARETRFPKKKKVEEMEDFDDLNDEDDEIDAFHKERDKIPLDLDDDLGVSSDDDVLPVLNYKDIDDEDEDEDEEDDDEESEVNDMIRKIKRAQRFLKTKTGGVEDEMHDDSEDDDEKKVGWGMGRSYHGADNVGAELNSSDADSLAEEEEEATRLQRERAKSLSLADFCIADASDTEPTFEELSKKGKDTSKPSGIADTKDEIGADYGEVKRDLSGLSRDELMEVMYSSAPELVGLLGELNDALQQLEQEVDPLLSRVQKKPTKKEGMHYLEVKRLLLLTYCQAITYYLLLKSEGLQVQDHPVVERLVDIKSLLDKVNQLDVNLPHGLVGMVSEDDEIAAATVSAEQKTASLSNAFPKDGDSNASSAGKQVKKSARNRTVHSKDSEEILVEEAAAPVKTDATKDSGRKLAKSHQHNKRLSKQSANMLKVRAALEEKLKQKGIITTSTQQEVGAKGHKSKLLNGRLETLDDFDDDAMNVDGAGHGLSNGKALRLSNKLSHFIAAKNKPKVVSGDDDLPKRDDIGERRRKHERRVLSGAGIERMDDDGHADDFPVSADDNGNVEAEGDSDNSEDDFYKQVKEKRDQKRALKAMKYSRNPTTPSEPEAIVDGKRQITTQMEKNRGLTRNRRKDQKNPRKKYRNKYDKAAKHRKGQVREFRREAGPYGGEASGINAGISRSVRFKN
ncbi:THALLO-like protein [Drosera capensis]